MIDKKKIKKAASAYEKKTQIECKKLNEKLNRGYEFSVTYKSADAAFIDGANWAIQEFLKDLWHPFNEVPTRKSSNILLFFESYSTGTEDDYDEYFELAYTREGFTQETWKEFVNEGGIPSKWLYINDLFPKKGGKQ